MIITLFTSRKLRSVTETEMYLGRQDSGYESFEPSQLSRYVVHQFLSFHRKLIKVLPAKVVIVLVKDMKETKKNADDEVGMYFDTVRASVNLVVASFLVAIGTYFTIPLSTTFVVFMVVMGTLVGRSGMGRDSAVFRLSGVFSILGGWFITAIMAFVEPLFWPYLYGGLKCMVLLYY